MVDKTRVKKLKKPPKKKEPKQKNKVLKGTYWNPRFWKMTHFKFYDNYIKKTPQRKTVKKKPGENHNGFLWVLFTRIIFVVLVLGFIYIVDFEKYVRIRDGAGYYANEVVRLLPPELVTKFKRGFEYSQPLVTLILTKINIFVNETSTFLNTDPRVSEHWTNFREISSICGALLVEYMRTLYRETTGFIMTLKKNYFNGGFS